MHFSPPAHAPAVGAKPIVKIKNIPGEWNKDSFRRVLKKNKVLNNFELSNCEAIIECKDYQESKKIASKFDGSMQGTFKLSATTEYIQT